MKNKRQYIEDLVKDIDEQYQSMSLPIIDELITLIQDEGYKLEDAIVKSFQDNNFSNNQRYIIEDALYKSACYGYGISPNINIKDKILSKLTKLPWDDSKLNLSQKLHHLNDNQYKETLNILNNNLKNGSNWVKLSRELYDGYKNGNKVINQTDLPQYLQRLKHIADKAFDDKTVSYQYTMELRKA